MEIARLLFRTRYVWRCICCCSCWFCVRLGCMRHILSPSQFFFFFFLCFFSLSPALLLSSPVLALLFSLLRTPEYLIVLTQIRGHVHVTPFSLPTTTGFVPCIFIARYLQLFLPSSTLVEFVTINTRINSTDIYVRNLQFWNSCIPTKKATSAS